MQLERRLFSDWLNWLCSDWNHERARAQFEATMDLVAAEMDREGVSATHLALDCRCTLEGLQVVTWGGLGRTGTAAGRGGG